MKTMDLFFRWLFNKGENEEVYYDELDCFGKGFVIGGAIMTAFGVFIFWIYL